MNKYFDISRFWLLLKLELYKSRMGVIITLDIAIGLLFIGMFMDILFTPSLTVHDHNEAYAFTLTIGGFVLSSLAFNGLSSSLKRFSYLTLPVSTFERWLCMWLLTSIGWIVLYSTVFFVYTLIANSVGRVIYDFVEFRPFDPFSGEVATTVVTYFVLQGMFLVGATHFKAYVFPKTLFSIFTSAFVIGFILFMALKDIFLTEHECKGYECEYVDTMGMHWVWAAIKFSFWWILAPLSWVISYFGLKDKEV